MKNPRLGKLGDSSSAPVVVDQLDALPSTLDVILWLGRWRVTDASVE
jgi:hypothetical protein